MILRVHVCRLVVPSPPRIENLTFSNVVINRVEGANDSIESIRLGMRVIGKDLVWDKFYSFAQVEIVARSSHDAIDRSRFDFYFRFEELKYTILAWE